MTGLHRIRLVGATLLGLVLVGCSGSGGTPSGESSRTTVSASAPPSASPTPVADSGWHTWTASYPAEDGRCEATAHQVVCRTGSGGFVGRSRSTGQVTWSVPPAGRGKDAELVVDSATERAVTTSGETLSAANLRTGKAAWTRRLTDGSAFPVVLRVADGTVFVLETPTAGAKIITLAAFRMSDGKALWHRSVAADLYGNMAAFGGRVYTTDGTKVTAREARTGEAVATSAKGVECPNLISGAHYLVCTGSPYSAGDVFPPLQRLDPDTLRPMKTAEDTGDKPERGVISSDGVLVLYEANAEDSSAGSWNAYDLVHPKRLWSYDDTTEEGELAGDRFLTFTPRNDAAVRDRVISIDLRAGPKGTGDAAPHLSPRYSQARGGEYPRLAVPGGDPGHVVVQAGTHRSLRSIPLP
ncbi:PQQ-like beta-propeller repeat protein [Streptomyces sp. NBC_01478]|uniref:outer membrane protein assembly factor BamB family protein n=1 Tax=Streptomyces sp. NBC_01478 TaxID=2903882 RepID=UPI002E329C28|nr:PQQ-binding-like beta-propeller repeat protein [Streptomyces sp. NBC_01478]